jgi:DNA modification methylase
MIRKLRKPRGSGSGSVASDNSAIESNLRTIKVQVQYRRIDSLSFGPRNPRQHPQKQVRQIADSIQEFGFVAPIVVDDRGEVIIGHGRALAAKYLQIAEVPVIQIRHLSSAQLTALRIADNKLALNAHWDERLLGESFAELQALDLDFSIEVTGFSLPEIDLTIQNLGLVADADVEAEGSAATGAPVCEPGDLWHLHEHRLLCGDATIGASFQRLLNGQVADLVFADFPYNVRIAGHVSGHGKTSHREFQQASGELSDREFARFLIRSSELLARNSTSGSIHFLCMDWRHADNLLAAGNEVYSELKNICVWVKDNAGMGSLYRSQHELVFVFKSGTAPHINNIELGKHGRHRTNVWNYPGASTTTRKGEKLLQLHPTAKPIPLVMDAILDCSHRGALVLDSFLGSGTTLLAAERTGRRCHGMELDPLYVDTAIRRWQNLTGRDARRSSDNKAFREIEADSERMNEKAGNTRHHRAGR